MSRMQLFDWRTRQAKNRKLYSEQSYRKLRIEHMEERRMLSGSDHGESGDIDDHELSAVPLWMAGYEATNNIEPNDTWLAFRSQSNLSLDEPISNVFYLASHNSFNSLGGTYPDEDDGVDTNQLWGPNQSISVINQLNAGARSIELDLYAGPATELPVNAIELAQLLAGLLDSEINLRLAHDTTLNGSFQIASLNRTIDGIKDWLDRPENTNEIIFLDFEDNVIAGLVDRAKPFLEAQLEKFGDMIYTPEDRFNSDDPHSWPTRREMIEAGKRVVIFTHRNDARPDGIFGSRTGGGSATNLGFSVQGTWTTGTAQGFQGDYHFSAFPPEIARANWTFSVEPGMYEVAATWDNNVHLASDAPYTVLDGVTPLLTLDVNQKLSPNDFSENGANWKKLGDFAITGTELSVQLSNEANSFVNADAIRIKKIGVPVEEANPQIIDNAVDIKWKYMGKAFLADGKGLEGQGNYEQASRSNIRSSGLSLHPEDANIFTSMQSDGIKLIGTDAAETHDLIYTASRNINFAKIDFILGYQNDVDNGFKTPDEDDPMQNDGPYGEDDPNTTNLDEGHKHRGDRLKGLIWSWAAGDPAVQRQLFQDLFHDNPDTPDEQESDGTGQALREMFSDYFNDSRNHNDKTLKDLQIAYEYRFGGSVDVSTIPNYLLADLDRRGITARNNGRDFVIQEAQGSNWISTNSSGDYAFALRSIKKDPSANKYRWKISTETGSYFDSNNVDLSAYTDADGMEYMFAGPLNGFQNGSFDIGMLHPDVRSFRDNEIRSDVLSPYQGGGFRPAYSVFEARIASKYHELVTQGGISLEDALAIAAINAPAVWINVHDVDRDGHWQVNGEPESLPAFESLVLTPDLLEGDTASLEGVFSNTASNNQYTLTIDWGDGSEIQTETINKSDHPEFSFEHIYVDDGNDNGDGIPLEDYAVTVSVLEGTENAGTVEFVIFVYNVDPEFTDLSSDKGLEKEPYILTGLFSDAGILDTHTVEIEWGEGTTTDGVVTFSDGTGSITGEHTYVDGGVFEVVVTLTDDDGGVTTVETTVFITGAGVYDGVLQIVGTDEDDLITVNRQGNDLYKVHADFFEGYNFKTFTASEIDSMKIWLCDGDDHLNIAGNIDLPYEVFSTREAIQIDYDHELIVHTNDYYNWGGRNEKWIVNTEGDWYFITPSGEFYKWQGKGSINNSTKLATLTSEYHSNLILLTEAADRYLLSHPAAAGKLLSVQLDGNYDFLEGNEYYDWGGLKEKWIKATDSTWLFITPDGNVHEWHGDSLDNHTLLGAVGVEYYNDLSLLQQAHDKYLNLIAANIIDALDPVLLVGQLGLIDSSNYSFNWGGRNEKWIRGAGNTWYFIVSTGDFYTWNNGDINNSTLLGILDSSYYDSPHLLFATAEAQAVDEAFFLLKDEVLI